MTSDRDCIGEWARIAGSLAAPMAERHRAFGNLVRRFQDMAFGCAFAILGDRTRAEDAAQEAFLAAWRGLPNLETPAAFSGWLKQIVIRISRRARRAEKANPPLTEGMGITTAPADEGAAERLLVREAVAALPEKERLTIILFYINENTREEVAAFLGVSAGAVKKRLASARTKLKERLLIAMQDELQGDRPSNNSAFADHVLAFTRLFSALIDEGLPLVHSLEKIAAQESDPEFRAAVKTLSQDLQDGQRLSYGMKKYPQYFDEKYIAIIREGEYHGNLEISLQKLAGK